MKEKEVISTATRTPIVLQPRQLVMPLVIGVVVGAGGWLLNMLLQNFLIEPIFCKSADSFTVCANGGTVAWGMAFVIAGIISVLVLARNTIYRPLLVVIMAFAALWGIGAWLAPMSWWMALLWSGVLFGLAYALFAWVASITRFWVALLISILLVVVSRLIIGL